jgi:RNA polymerase sigma-70 factor, ECF subfamily
VGDLLSETVADLNTEARTLLDHMMPGVYAELRKLAASYMQSERREHTLQPTALVHEAYLRMSCQRTVDWRNRSQLMAVAARIMRRILLDYAQARNTGKRGGRLERLSLTDDLSLGATGFIDLLEFDDALERLKELDPQQAAVVELRVFGGLEHDEVAEALRLSPATVRRRWSSARLWLARHWKREEA